MKRYTTIDLTKEGFTINTNDDLVMFKFDGLCRICKSYKEIESTTDDYNTIISKTYYCNNPELICFSIPGNYVLLNR